MSQGHHLKGGQRTAGRSHILLLSEQPQQDVFLILGPAVNVSVLEPGGHMLLWERGQEQRSRERSLDPGSGAQFRTVLAWPSIGVPARLSWELLFCFWRV